MISSSPSVLRIDAATEMVVHAPGALRPDISLVFDFSLRLTNFAPEEREAELHVWLSHFQEQTACTFSLQEEPGDRVTKPRRVAFLVSAPSMPADCCVDVDLVTAVPNPDLPGSRGRIMSGYASVPVLELLELEKGEGMEVDVAIGGDKYVKATMAITMREKAKVLCPVLQHPLLERKALKRLLKKFKYAGLSMFDNSNRAGIKPLRDVCRRTHVLSWRTRWGHLPTEFFFVDNTRGCGTPSEGFFVRLLDEALDARCASRKEMLEVARLQFVDRRSSHDFDERFHRLCLVFATMLQLVCCSAAYITDLWYRANGSVEERDSYDDMIARRGFGDCEEYARIACWLVCWLRKFGKIRDPLLAYVQMIADLYIESGADGNVSANKAGNNARASGDDFGAHMFAVLIPIVKFEEMARRGSGQASFSAPRYGGRSPHPWERRLRTLLIEGTSRVYPFLEPYADIFPSCAAAMRKERALQNKAWKFLRDLDPSLFGEVLSRESYHGLERYSYERSKFETGWSASLYDFYRTINEGYSGYWIERGGRLGRWAYVIKMGGEWRYGVPIESLAFDDPNVGVMFEMPLTEAVLCATKIALEHVRRTPARPAEGRPSAYADAEAAVLASAANRKGVAAAVLDLYTEPRAIPERRALEAALAKLAEQPWFLGAEFRASRFFDGFESARLRIKIAEG